MLKSIVISSGVLAFCFTGGALAQHSMSQEATTVAAAPVQTSAANPLSTERHNHRVIKPGDRNCLRDTGSLIRTKKGECLPVVGSSYTQQDLRRTGTQDMARSLQMLDPSISIGH